MVITIDGPVAGGKSSIARDIASRLNIYYLSTGMLYRGLAYILVNEFGYKENDLFRPKLDDIKLALMSDKFNYEYDAKTKEKLLWENEDISSKLKNKELDKYASIISSNKMVRDALLDFQRKFAGKYDLVAEGRDCGSIVFPDADFKFYLVADIKNRAERWRELEHKQGNQYSLEEAIDILTERDKRDSMRSVAPLIKPDDAIVIDNTNISEEDTLKRILSYITSG